MTGTAPASYACFQALATERLRSYKISKKNLVPVRFVFWLQQLFSIKVNRHTSNCWALWMAACTFFALTLHDTNIFRNLWKEFSSLESSHTANRTVHKAILYYESMHDVSQKGVLWLLKKYFKNCVIKRTSGKNNYSCLPFFDFTFQH